MKKEFTNEQIEAMEEKGGKRWIKGDYDRMYVNSEFIGFEYKLSRCGQFVVNHNTIIKRISESLNLCILTHVIWPQ